MPIRIVSGGQTGADRGALDAAIDLGLPCGGHAPLGWRAEDGTIPDRYRTYLQQAATADWKARTVLNIEHSDATLIFSQARHLTGGSAFTQAEAKRQGKPMRHVVLRGFSWEEVARVDFWVWIDAHQVRVLNVAGPRESKDPGIQRAVREALSWLLAQGDGAAL